MDEVRHHWAQNCGGQRGSRDKPH